MRGNVNRKELIYDVVLFALSCVNTGMIYAFLILVFFKILQGSEGYLKMNLLFLIRSVFYIPGLPVMTGAQNSVKMLLLAAASVWVLVKYLQRMDMCVPRYVGGMLAFSCVACISAGICGSYPIAGVVKVIYFMLVFVTTVLAVESCAKSFDVETYVYRWLSGVLFLSLLLMPFDEAYKVGSAGLLFRGIWNHPNDFGVVCAIYLALTLVRSRELSGRQLINIVVVFVMIFMSRSRGALISAAGTIVVYYIYCKNPRERKIIAILGVVSMLALLFTPFGEALVQFFVKGSEEATTDGGVFHSRSEIWEVAMMRFQSNPLFGRGLLISYKPDVVSFIFDEKGYEPGNIVLELLAGTGIVGTIAFFCMIFSFYSMAVGKRKILATTAVLASISEVSFFSVNNYAFIYYVILAFCILPGEIVLQENRTNQTIKGVFQATRKRKGIACGYETIGETGSTRKGDQS